MGVWSRSEQYIPNFNDLRRPQLKKNLLSAVHRCKFSENEIDAEV